MPHPLRIALAGNPNVGKSTLFNALTGARQHVGNWPGKTVERAAGLLRYGDLSVELVDLPGAYSLAAYSPEEAITRDFLTLERPDLVLNVVDAVNLERNLYLTLQILETGVPTLVVVSMLDEAEQRGMTIDCAALSTALGGTPVLPSVTRDGRGLAALRTALLEWAQGGREKGGAPCPCCS